jgi:signal transduction histidine kinase
VLLHVRLLVRILGHFYQAKRREQNLREITRLQTIYETGARLTHDLKNMLQSLMALTAIARELPERAQPVLQRQLPVLTQRIELILAKLKTPQAQEDVVEMPLATWWAGLRQRHQHHHIECRSMGNIGNQPVPIALFDCVADNLIDNASNKRMREPSITVTLTLLSQPFSLSISDSGSAIPDRVAHQLMNTIISSENGMGIGLYQVARWAAQSGYRLELSENTQGKVTFRITKAE